MNKYVLQPVLFDSFLTGNFLLKKIFAFIFFLSLLFSFNSVSAQWTQQTIPVSNSFQNVFFLNDNTGWVSSTSLSTTDFVKTTNGGSNWINYSSSEMVFINDICFINENTGFLAGGFNFYKTTNGGINWTATEPAGFLDIFFINDLIGWRSKGAIGIEKTTDSGNNWILQLPSDLNVTFCSIYFLNNNTGWSCTGENPLDPEGSVYRTTNGGANWQKIWNDEDVGLDKIRFSDLNNGTVADFRNNRVLKTSDGGTNWTPIPGDGTDSYFLNASTGWIFGNTIRFTTNGGNSFTIQSSDFTAEACFTNTGIGYAVGGERILKYGPPSIPGLTATLISTSQINLSWTASDYAEKYFIERSPNGATGWTSLDSVNGNVTTYQNTGLNADQGYYYRVYAKKFYFTSGYSNVASARTFMNPPALVSPENGAVIPTVLPVQWSTVTNGFFYTVQVASDSSFNNIAYTTITTAPIAFPENLQNSTKYYWRVKTAKFDGSNESQYSAFRSFILQNPNYGHNMSSGNNLYHFANSTSGSNPSPSKPTYSWRDTTGSTNLILNGTLQTSVTEGNIDDGRFNITGKLPPGNSIRFFGTNYQNLNIGTNGIVAFTSFVPGSLGSYEPISSLPQTNILNAIFPFWKDLDYSDVDVPVNRLCYKVISNEIIITYLRAPVYQANPQDYVSFQVIISHSASPSVNSNILIMYSDDLTGSTFKTNYNNNTLDPYLIGLQGANSGSQVLQYRYLNSTPQLISFGPMFGSNMALAMGPNANILPVELASFTSTVNANNVQLNWSTVSEENNSGFEVERMSIVNGQSSMWNKVGSVQGNGTTSEIKNYSYEDKNIPSGNYKYRLKQVDYNGNFEYHELSGEVIVGVPAKFALSQNYPNPFNPTTKINFEIPSNVSGKLSIVKLHVYDVTGRMIAELVNKQMEAGYYTVDFNGANFASGIYFYRLSTNDFVQTKKMLLVK